MTTTTATASVSGTAETTGELAPLDGTVALVTVASSGIGAATARRLAGSGGPS